MFNEGVFTPPGSASGIVNSRNITYAALLVKYNAGTMVPGYYTITDFATKQLIPNTSTTNTGATEPLIVWAISASKLAVQAYSPSKPFDIIYYNIIDSTGENPGGGVSKGIITYRKDTLINLSAYTNWRAVKYRRWETALGNGTYLALTSPGGGALSKDFYLFGNTISVNGNIYTPAVGGAIDAGTYNTSLGPTISGSYNTIFGTGAYNNVIGNQCVDNTISNNFAYNTGGNDFIENIISLTFQNNSFGDSFMENEFSGSVESNKFGYFFSGNTAENNFAFNTIAPYCQENVFGSGFTNNDVRKGCSTNVFGDDTSYNVIYDDFATNTFGNSMFGNVIENSATDNEVGDNFWTNKCGVAFVGHNIGDDCQVNIFGTDCSNNTIGNTCQNNILQSGFSSNTIVNNFRKNIVVEGVANTDFSTATKVYNTYTTNIIQRSDNTYQLYYWTGANVLTYAAITA